MKSSTVLPRLYPSFMYVYIYRRVFHTRADITEPNPHVFSRRVFTLLRAGTAGMLLAFITLGLELYSVPRNKRLSLTRVPKRKERSYMKIKNERMFLKKEAFQKGK